VTTIPLTKAKARFSGLVDRLINLREHVVITKHGKPVAALVPYEEWEKLAAAKTGGLASVPRPPKDLDADIEAMIDGIYESRRRSKPRQPAL
jgi:prevent-host-death family protein